MPPLQKHVPAGGHVWQSEDAAPHDPTSCQQAAFCTAKTLPDIWNWHIVRQHRVGLDATSKSHLACIYAALEPWNSWRSALSIVPRRSPAATVALAAGCSTSSWLNTCLLLRLLKPPARRPYLLLSPMPETILSGSPLALPQCCHSMISFLRGPLETPAGVPGRTDRSSRPEPCSRGLWSAFS